VNRRARAIIELLGLAPHPEGGFYREMFRSPLDVDTQEGHRAASTAIYFLLPGGTLSALHRVRSDEVWHHYGGDPVALHILRDGSHQILRLGRDLAGGERPQQVVVAGVLQAAVPSGSDYALCGCTVAPGFDFADFEMPSRAELTAQMPALRDAIAKLTRR
jgi:predicted cupin superfamily sugar epimerase